MAVEAEFSEDVQRLRQSLALLVGPVFRGERLEDVCDAHDPRLHRHLVPHESFRVALSIHALMVTAGVLRHVLQVARPRQGFEHLDRRDDVMIDDLPLLLGKRAAPDREILKLILGQEARLMAGHIGPAVFGDAFDPLDIGIAHSLAADIAGAQKSAIFVDPANALAVSGLEFARFRVAARCGQAQLFFHEIYFCISLEDLKARVDEVNPVVDGFELGRFVDDMHRRRDLPAIMKQSRDLQLIPVLVVHPEITEWPLFRLGNRFRQHHRERRHALAMSARVGRFLVDCRVHQVDERFEQFFKLVDEHPVSEGDRCLRGK